jgi:ribosomal protein S27AE
MTTADHFINLNCPNCGGKLDVYDDMDRFACGFCGSEMIVNRRGGTVALKAVTEAIKQVQVGTDKTAAELAMVRLNQEAAELNAKLAHQRETDQECA